MKFADNWLNGRTALVRKGSGGGVKGKEETFTHQPAFFLPCKSIQFMKIPMEGLVNIQLWFLDLTPVHFYRLDCVSAKRRYFAVHAVT